MSRHRFVFGNCKSFSAEEDRILESLVKTHQDVVESKENNNTALWQRKVETWKRIGAEFELQSKTNRSWPALWEKYLKSRMNSVSASNSSEPIEQEHSTNSPVSLKDEWKILEDEYLKQLDVAQDYYKSESSKQTGNWKVQLENAKINSKRRRMESSIKLEELDRQMMELQALANRLRYR